MKSPIAAALLCAAFAAPVHAVKPEALIGTWETARSSDDERTYVRLLEKGKAQIVAEYDFQLPNMPGKRRGRSTTFGKWSVKGDDVLVIYAKVHDRLHYSDRLPLAEVGLDGVAAGLKPVGKADANSRIQKTLWKAPHDYKLKGQEAAAGGQADRGPAAPAR